ncbi:AAA family ATPase [Fibrobacter sp.]|uniref:AAA family ATPase n=1 Tax=Fibrobacter sp. TaxID=35828 RepID=UPI00262E3AF9|nr:AAA family ATPase [Fibrobacter sp.]
MTSYEIAHLLEKLGVRETKAETYPNTYSLVNGASFLAQQVSNRDSASWKKAEYIILTDSQVSQGILNGWKKLTERDPLPSAIQKLCIPNSGGQFDVYDSQGKLIESNSLDRIIKHTPDIVDFLNSKQSLINTNLIQSNHPFTPSQIIYYGVPGCGKSNKIREQLKDVPEKNKVRVVFHPEYTNAEFIGQILPVTNGGIRYEFTPGPFTQIIKRAYLSPNEHFYLVIEEINRGNAAAIFGDTFQLLDRLKAGETDSLGNDPANAAVNTFTEGWSQYFVQNDDVNAYIRKATKLDDGSYQERNDGEPIEEIKIKDIHFNANTAIRLPPNLSILATMNTSDQNVFTLDNAFQRRFDMELVRNEFDLTKPAVNAQYNAEIDDTGIKWGQFWGWINAKITSTLKGLSSTEDKRLGVWFVSNVGGIIDDKVFAEKVLKFLWDDVFKFKRPQIFADGIDTLEKLINFFENPEGKERFDVFKDKANLVAFVASPTL